MDMAMHLIGDLGACSPMGAHRSFVCGGGGGSPQKTPHMEKRVPHKKERIAKRHPYGEQAPLPPTGEKIAKRPPTQRKNLREDFPGGGGYAFPSLWTPMCSSENVFY